jgi:phage protein U
MLYTAPGAADPSRRPRSTVRMFDPLGGTVVRLPWMPDEIETTNTAQAWTQLARPGRYPLLLAQGKSLPVITFPARLVQPGQADTVDGTITALEKLARSSNPLRLDIGGLYRGDYRITALTKTETKWTADGRVVDAEVQIELTRASDMVVAVGPIKRKTLKAKIGRFRARAKGMARNV